MSRIYDVVNYVFDPLHAFWESQKVKSALAQGLIVTFALGVAGIELNRQGLLPEALALLTPTKHFYAIKLAFTLVLMIEVVDLVFILPSSVSQAVGKQFEILSLILLRNAFKKLVYFQEPITVTDAPDVLLPLLADGAGALIIFACLGHYYRLHRSLPKGKAKRKGYLYGFVSAKKLVSLALLGVFCGVAAHSLVGFLTTGHGVDFFKIFYTVLIFSDILIVLIAQLHQPCFHAVFRNSGFALSTLLIRLALAAPAYYDAGIGVCAVMFAIGLTYAYREYITKADASQLH